MSQRRNRCQNQSDIELGVIRSKLNIEDIDPSFTIGQLEMLRLKIIQRLKEEGN
ncbi:MAG: hypothetical protein IPL63_11195 [Saprospiraceae bacterium]|nr:hypothetical protein [Saprospiraceae bacterium]